MGYDGSTCQASYYKNTTEFIVGVVKVGRYIILHRSIFFCDYCALAKNFRLGQPKKPNFDYPQMQIYCTKYHKSDACVFVACVLCEQNENTNLLQGYTKKVIFGVTVIFGVFCVSTNQICFANIVYICKMKNCPTLTTPSQPHHENVRIRKWYCQICEPWLPWFKIHGNQHCKWVPILI